MTVEWISVDEQTPSQGERVLLKIDQEDNPVVGYWGSGRYEVCTVNISCHTCHGNLEANFRSEDVTLWMRIPNAPSSIDQLIGDRTCNSCGCVERYGNFPFCLECDKCADCGCYDDCEGHISRESLMLKLLGGASSSGDK